MQREVRGENQGVVDGSGAAGVGAGAWVERGEEQARAYVLILF